MILEFLRHTFLPSPKIIKDLGYVREILAIEARYKRNKESWQPHLDNTKRNILQVAKSLTKHRKCVIFGSGLLLDIPLLELSGMFNQIDLVDVVHLPDVERYATTLGNVHCIQHDCTEYVGRLHSFIQTLPRKVTSSLPEVELPGLYLDSTEIDLVISCNILSQLSLIPYNFIAKSVAVPESVINRASMQLVKQHLAYLESFIGADVLLISDIERRTYTSDGVCVERESALEGITLPNEIEEWDWHIAPRPELFRDKDVVHRVRVVHFTNPDMKIA
jgi:hypothetical protein